MGERSFSSFEEFECWRASKVVKDDIIRLIKSFPEAEKYDLIDNMKRATSSATRNIAEGFGRYHFKENVQFCRISSGSLFELIDDLISARDEKYITSKEYIEVRNKIDVALKLLNGYIRYLNNKKPS